MIENDLLLRNSAFLCRSGRYFVFLDLHNDKYLCINTADFDALGPWIYGHVAYRPSIADRPCLQGRLETLANEMISLGLITTATPEGKRASGIAVKSPERSISTAPKRVGIRSALQIYDFITAARVARSSLVNDSLEKTVSRIIDRKRRAARNNSQDDQTLIRLTGTFSALRNLFPRNYLCLFDSLALVEFLARNGLYPDWVFGVTSEPFDAHCWVQQGDLLLNDTLEDVSTYVPIMCV